MGNGAGQMGKDAAVELPELLRDVAAAPGRGPLRAGPIWERQAGGTRRLAGVGLQVADVWDRIELAARKAHARKGGGAVYVAPFTPGQVATARHYAGLTEAYAAGLLRGQAIDSTGGGDPAQAIDAWCDTAALWRRYRDRIGPGFVTGLRRVRPSARGEARLVREVALVDAVAIEGLTLTQVLARHGWADNGRYREALRVALVGALDRMQGYGLRRAAK